MFKRILPRQSGPFGAPRDRRSPVAALRPEDYAEKIMSTSFAAVVFRPEDVPDRALSHGFAIALAGWDVPAPRVLIAPLRGIDGWWAAFYQSGITSGNRTAYEEFADACELFEDDLPPGLCVRDAAAECGAPDAVVYSIVFAHDFLHDDVTRFAADGITRRFVRDGEDGFEAGVSTPEHSDLTPIEIDLPDGAPAHEEQAAVDQAVREKRGSAFLSRELGRPVEGELMGALFAPERRLYVRLIEPGPESIEAEVRHLNRVLRRTDGRAAFTLPHAVHAAALPPAYAAFVRTYDWADPSDPADLYRELAIGALEGTLRFLREQDLKKLDTDPLWNAPAAAGLFPIAVLRASTLGSVRSGETIIALAADCEHLVYVAPDGNRGPIGPTFGELLRYLALGWKKRNDIEEDLIGALMLRARLRSTKGTSSFLSTLNDTTDARHTKSTRHAG